jgi:hypothetical protein
MAVATTNLYGAFDNPGDFGITEYGVATDKYGVIQDPITSTGKLLLETGDALLQEDGSYILL